MSISFGVLVALMVAAPASCSDLVAGPDEMPASELPPDEAATVQLPAHVATSLEVQTSFAPSSTTFPDSFSLLTDTVGAAHEAQEPSPVEEGPPGQAIPADAVWIGRIVETVVEETIMDTLGSKLPAVQGKHESHVANSTGKGLEILAEKLGVGIHSGGNAAGRAVSDPEGKPIFTIQGVTRAPDGGFLAGRPILVASVQESPLNPIRPAAGAQADTLSMTAVGAIGGPQPPAFSVLAIIVGGAVLVHIAYPRLQFGSGRISAWLAQFPLFQRAATRKENLLKNPARATIFDALQHEPGITISLLCKRLNKGWGTVYYHVYQLESNGFAKHVRSGGQKLFFRKDVGDEDCEVAGVLRKRCSRGLLEAVGRFPGIRQKDLLNLVHTSRRVFGVYLACFLRFGLVTEAPDPTDRRVRRYHLTPRGTAALEPQPAVAAAATKERHAGLMHSALEIPLSGLGRLETAILRPVEAPPTGEAVPRSRKGFDGRNREVRSTSSCQFSLSDAG